MKKTIISLLALTACISANAQTMKIYKGTTLVAEYPADQADNIILPREQRTANNEEVHTGKVYRRGLRWSHFYIILHHRRSRLNNRGYQQGHIRLVASLCLSRQPDSEYVIRPHHCLIYPE